MPRVMTLPEFRRELDAITQLPSSRDWWPKIQDLRASFPHSIERVDEPKTRHPNYNCFMFALGLHHSLVHYVRCASSEFTRMADTCFLTMLLRRGVLTALDRETRQEGDLIVYFHGDLPMHAGIHSSGKVISKWGTGLLLSHRMLEVPESYGDAKCYEAVQLETIEDNYKIYTEFMNGVA